MTRLRYLGFRANSALFHWIRRRFTKAGWLVLAALTASAVWGVDTSQTMAYQSFTFLAALLTLAALSGGAFKPRLRLRRVLPRFATAGEPLAYAIEVEAEAAAPGGLLVSESLPDPRPSYAEFRSARLSGGNTPWFDLLVGLSLWRNLVLLKSQASTEEVELPEMPAGGSCRIDAKLEPLRRGVLRLSGLAVARPDPFGVWKSSVVVPQEQSVAVLPRRYPVPSLTLPGARRYQQGGVALSSAVGDSQEFASLRDYRPGDPLRRIHWRSWAKTGKPIVRENLDEYFVRHALALDTAGPEGAAFEEAVSVAASFACSVLTQESLLDLLFVGSEAYCFSAGRGLGGTDRMLEILAGVQAWPGRPFKDLADSVLRRHSSLSGCLCVLLSFDEERREFVRRLRGMGVPSLIVVVGPKEETAEPVHFLQPGRVAQGLAALS